MHQITLTASQNVLMNHINEHSVQSMCSKCPHTSQTVAPLVNRSIDNVLFKVEPSLRQTFSQVVDVMNLCFVHALLHNTSNK